MARIQPGSEELQQLLEAVSVLQVVVTKGREELRYLAPYLVSFGAYGVGNVLAVLLGGRGWWVETLLPAFAIATVLATGVFPTLLYWIGAAAVVIAAALWGAGKPVVLWLAFLVGTTAAMWLTYWSAERQGKVLRGFSISSRIGAAWGLMVAGIWLMTVSPAASTAPRELLWAVWGYALGVGFLLLSVLNSVFLPVALVGIFGQPAAILYVRSPEVSLGLYGVMCGALCGIGVWLLLKGQPRQ